MIVLLKPRCAETVSTRFNEVNFVLTSSGAKVTDLVRSNELYLVQMSFGRKESLRILIYFV